MIFNTTVNGVPCQCKVESYTPYIPMRITGSGFGDCDPPEGEEFEYEILDLRGRSAPWLTKYLNEKTDERLLDEYRVMRDAEYFHQI